jgi:hypothetical protein
MTTIRISMSRGADWYGITRDKKWWRAVSKKDIISGFLWWWWSSRFITTKHLE